MTYMNTSCFTISLIPTLGAKVYRIWKSGHFFGARSLNDVIDRYDSYLDESAKQQQKQQQHDKDIEGLFDREQNCRTPLLAGSSSSSSTSLDSEDDSGVKVNHRKLGFRETVKIAFEFCLLWFSANYFAFACLQFTSVASTTILNSTSGIWTLIFGILGRVERFNSKKIGGVFISLVGIILISRVDLSDSVDDTGSFPQKSPAEMALGDSMAALSAALYGVYTVVMKRQVGDESAVDMTLFFGLVGLINTVMLWPGFILLHVTGIETFAVPATGRVWFVLVSNAIVSLVSDVAWAYAMLLTTPLVVTVGLSLTIPLSLVGQIFIHGQYSSLAYWAGAACVFFSFLIVNHES
ncbi:hypothetical protein KEM56_002304 [Ascosphaera pollenicola]|nr:hypothetical protein KEM56_002304 [Ascosphaera pollenicola]